MEPGTLAILNVGSGDTKLSFDHKKPAEVKHARKVITEMLRQGYAILVHVGTRNGEPLYQRAHDFDPKTDEYIIVGAPESDQDKAAPTKKETSKTRGRRCKASGTRAVAIARSAGG